MVLNPARGDRGEDLHEDRRRWNDRDSRPRSRAQGRPPHRGLRHGRRAQRGAGRRQGARPGCSRRRAWSPSSRTSCSSSAPLWPTPPRTARFTTPSPRHTSSSSNGRSMHSRPSSSRSTQFILPGGVPPAAQISTWRGRSAAAPSAWSSSSRTSPARPSLASVLVYLNRLSDLLFVLARAVNHRARVADVLWKGI